MNRLWEKLLLFILVFALFNHFAADAQEKGFIIKGHLTGLKDGEKIKVYLYPYENKPVCLDSTICKHENFEFNGFLKGGLQSASLNFISNGQSYIRFFNLDNTIIEVSGKLDSNLEPGESVIIRGSPLMDDIRFIGSSIDILSSTNRELTGTYSKGYLDKLKDSIGYNQKVMDGIMTMKNLYMNSFKRILTEDYDQSYAALPVVFAQYHSSVGFASFWPVLYDKLNVQIKNTYYGKLMKEKLPLCIGQPAPAFSSTTTDGKTLSLHDVVSKSKLTFIDFWASWCAYCREMGRNTLVPLYQKYHDKGFNILGVSRDDDATRWKKAIADDHYTWPQVSDLKGQDDPIYKLYDSKTPGNVLVDGNGKIVAWNVFDPLELEWYINKYTEQ